MTGTEILAALEKSPMTATQLWMATGLPYRRVLDHLHRVLRPSGKVVADGKCSYWTIYRRVDTICR